MKNRTISVNGTDWGTVHIGQAHKHGITPSDVMTISSCSDDPVSLAGPMIDQSSRQASPDEIRTAILEAARPYPELRDLRVGFSTGDDGARLILSRRWPREDRLVCKSVPVATSTYSGLRASAAMLAKETAEAWTYIAKPDACPVCPVALGGACEACSGSSSAEQLSDALPEPTISTESQPCAAYHEGPQTTPYVPTINELVRVVRTDMCAAPAIRAPVGLVGRVLHHSAMDGTVMVMAGTDGGRWAAEVAPVSPPGSPEGPDPMLPNDPRAPGEPS